MRQMSKVSLEDFPKTYRLQFIGKVMFVVNAGRKKLQERFMVHLYVSVRASAEYSAALLLDGISGPSPAEMGLSPLKDI